ncbi:MAG: hypothetical protein IT162_02740 [Bryobacterales bacterium]|nr:hypothetical protein [Bryobacterales bacterium]
MQFFGQGKPPVGVLYDADFGRSVSQALALCLLYGLDGKNETRVVSISVSKPNLKAAASAEVFGRFYAGAVSGAFGAVGRLLPTGLADGGADPAVTPVIEAVLKGREHGLQTINDTAETSPLLRNALTAQHDANSLVVLNGPATNLAALLDLPGAKGWIEKKCRMLVVSADGLIQSPAQAKAAAKVFAEWPGSIMFVPAAAADGVKYPAASIEADFAWAAAPGHPLVDAYRAGGAMPYDAASTDMAAVLFAVREKDKLFGVSEAGTLSVNGSEVSFTAAAGGRHQQLLAPVDADKVRKTFIELVTAKPVVRVRRFRPPVAEEPKKPATPPPPAGAAPPKQTP